jgi:NhaP-type Na+/H+ or K+/H+ antiporter
MSATWEIDMCDKIDVGHGLMDRATYARMLNDEADDTEELKEELAEVAPYEVLIFMFVATTLGALTSYVLSRYAPTIPFTAVMLVEGIILSILHDYSGHGLGTLSASIEMWVQIQPRLLLYCFLPALVFPDAMKLNFFMAKRCLWEIFVLAGPGVLLGTYLTALVAQYILPYGWDFSFCMAFGTILSATDPVAVVGLLKELGASPRLTMTVAGESLMNDGSAIVVFKLFFDMYCGATYTPYGIVMFFVQEALCAPIFGAGMGILALIVISMASRKEDPGDIVIQVCITITCAYLTFVVAEIEAEVSGVLATCGAALVLSCYAWPLITSHEVMENVWETIEYIGNTLLFMLAGLIVGNVVYVRVDVIHWSDYIHLLILYVIMTGIRFFIVCVSFPLVKIFVPDRKFSLNEAVMMTWAGLRGAVALCLAIMIDVSDEEVDHADGSRVMFLVAGFATLTLLINATTAGMMLRALGLAGNNTPAQQALVSSAKRGIERSLEKKFKGMVATSAFGDFDKAMVEEHCPFLREQTVEISEAQRQRGTVKFTRRRLPSGSYEAVARRASQNGASRETGLGQDSAVYYVRQVFLQVLKSSYWEQIEIGFLPEDSNAAITLLNSVDVCVDQNAIALRDGSPYELNDWQIVFPNTRMAKGWVKCFGWFSGILPESWTFGDHFRESQIVQSRMQAYILMTSYIRAHQHAQKMMITYFGNPDNADTPEEQQILKESTKGIHSAERERSKLETRTYGKELGEGGASRAIVNVLMRERFSLVGKLVSEGLLTQTDADGEYEDIQKVLVGLRKHESKFARKMVKEELTNQRVSPERRDLRQRPSFNNMSVADAAELGIPSQGLLPNNDPAVKNFQVDSSKKAQPLAVSPADGGSYL